MILYMIILKPKFFKKKKAVEAEKQDLELIKTQNNLLKIKKNKKTCGCC